MEKFRENFLKRIDCKELFFCRYCNREITKENYNIDHKTPRSRGGKNDESNLQIICRGCNSQKGDKTEEEFDEYLYPKTIGVVPSEELSEYNLYLKLHKKYKKYGIHYKI